MATEPTPTDAELAAMRAEFGITSNGRGIKEFTQVRDFARAVLAKWGTPPAVAGEPCGWAVFRPDGSLVHGSCEDSADACLFALSESEVACGRKPGYMAATKGWKPQPIYTTPQPTQAQAGAVPLTDEQIDALWASQKLNVPQIVNRRTLARAVEAAHGITKGA